MTVHEHTAHNRYALEIKNCKSGKKLHRTLHIVSVADGHKRVEKWSGEVNWTKIKVNWWLMRWSLRCLSWVNLAECRSMTTYYGFAFNNFNLTRKFGPSRWCSLNCAWNAVQSLFKYIFHQRQWSVRNFHVYRVHSGTCSFSVRHGLWRIWHFSEHVLMNFYDTCLVITIKEFHHSEDFDIKKYKKISTNLIRLGVLIRIWIF